MELKNGTIPSLCPVTQWINTNNPFRSKILTAQTPLDLRPSGMIWYEFSDSLIGCFDCEECIQTGKIHPGVCDYKTMGETIGLPDRFWSILSGAEDKEDLLTAIIVGLHASWWCEDMRDVSNCKEFRMNVTGYIEQYHKQGGILNPIPGLDEVIRADLLRRSCQFGMVPDVVSSGLEIADNLIIQDALRFEAEKVKTWDTLCYSFALEPIDMHFLRNLQRKELFEEVGL